MEKMRLILIPSTASSAGIAGELLGHDRVDAGTDFTSVVYVEVTEDEFETFVALMAEQGIKEVPVRGALSLSD